MHVNVQSVSLKIYSNTNICHFYFSCVHTTWQMNENCWNKVKLLNSHNLRSVLGAKQFNKFPVEPIKEYKYKLLSVDIISWFIEKANPISTLFSEGYKTNSIINIYVDKWLNFFPWFYRNECDKLRAMENHRWRFLMSS